MRKPAMKYGFRLAVFTDQEVQIVAKRYGCTVTGVMGRDYRTNTWAMPKVSASFQSLNTGEAERVARMITSLSAFMRKCWIDAVRDEEKLARLPDRV